MMRKGHNNVANRIINRPSRNSKRKRQRPANDAQVSATASLACLRTVGSSNRREDVKGTPMMRKATNLWPTASLAVRCCRRPANDTHLRYALSSSCAGTRPETTGTLAKRFGKPERATNPKRYKLEASQRSRTIVAASTRYRIVTVWSWHCRSIGGVSLHRQKSVVASSLAFSTVAASPQHRQNDARQ